MNEQLKKLLDERIRDLPPAVMVAIKNVPWVEKVAKIAKENNLDSEKTDSFAMETAILVFGMESPEKYPLNLAQQVGLDDGLVIKISKEVENEILAPISKALEKTEQSSGLKLTTEAKKDKGENVLEKEESGKALEATTVPEIAPEIHPMIEEGETVHDVPHKEPTSQTPAPAQPTPAEKESQKIPENLPVKPTPITPLPDYRYPDGQDPYREPLG